MGNRVFKEITIETMLQYSYENHVKRPRETVKTLRQVKLKINNNAKTVGNNCVHTLMAKKYGKLIKRTPNQNTQMVAALTIIIFKFDQGVNNKLSNVHVLLIIAIQLKTNK